MLFPAASGQGVKIAVIDSGVNAAHPHITAPVTKVSLGAPEEGASQEDTLGHGTAVMAAIQEKAPGAEYFAVKLFGSSLRTTTERLIEAVEWAIANRMDVINLSLGTTRLEARSLFEKLVERAWSSGCALVSAREARPRTLLPGSLPEVIGVDVDWDLPRDRYRIATVGGLPTFFASGYPRSLPGVPPARNINGISFAVANMTGFVARACEGLEERSFARIHAALASEIREQASESAAPSPPEDSSSPVLPVSLD
jgi:subtilisin family serine protease